MVTVTVRDRVRRGTYPAEERARCRAGDHGLCDPGKPQHGVCSRCGKVVRIGAASLSLPVCHACRRETVVQSPSQVCEWCGKQFVPGRRASYRPPARFCSRSCAKRKLPGAKSGLRSCEICGQPYVATYVAQRTCGRMCGVELRRREGTFRQPRVAPSCRIWVRDCAWCGRCYVARRERSRVCGRDCGRKLSWSESNAAQAQDRGDRRCAGCGVVVEPKRNRCDACKAETRRNRKRRERARKFGARRESYTLAEIAERDLYRCGICIAEGRGRQARVAMTRAVPHPKAPTIDHVVPLSVSQDDTRANVQLAHFSCNARKHVGGSQQLAMIG